MRSLQQNLVEREAHLRKIIKSLNKVSGIDSRDIRKIANKSCSSQKQVTSRERQTDELLRGDENKNLPNLLKATRIFDKKSNKVESIKEKQIDSEASMKRVNFQYKKLQLKKEKIARKHHQSQERYRSSPRLEQNIINHEEIRQKHVSEIFEPGTLKKLTEKQKNEENVIRRLKATMHSSRKYIQTAHQDQQYLKSMISSRRGNKELRSERSAGDNQFAFLTEADQSPDKLPPPPTFTKTQSIVINPKESIAKRKSLIDLIHLSQSRNKDKQEKPDQRMTIKETNQHNSVEQTILTLRKHIDKDNKLKESIVFSGLKKLLYGQRKGRFIQENAFKTRLNGQCSDQYLNVLKEQQQLLKGFNGSYINRRNLAEKFADILGKINKTERPHREDFFQ